MVLALQLFYILRKFGSVGLLGPGIALSLIRELGPVLCALMITGRAGSALTAEIGMMRISEQIDALTAMALNPIRYLIVPNIVGAIIVFPTPYQHIQCCWHIRRVSCRGKNPRDKLRHLLLPYEGLC